jgi:RES domain-containing protein
LTPLPPLLGGIELVAWRLDLVRFSATWDSGEGAYRVGGRWNSRGIRAVYCSIDPSTAILEVAVHKGFHALDTVPHILTAATISEASAVHVVDPKSKLAETGNSERGSAGIRRCVARAAQIRGHSERGFPP